MAKSLRSKWKRKMRKVQREEADVKLTKKMVEKFQKIEKEEAEIMEGFNLYFNFKIYLYKRLISAQKSRADVSKPGSFFDILILIFFNL